MTTLILKPRIWHDQWSYFRRTVCRIAIGTKISTSYNYFNQTRNCSWLTFHCKSFPAEYRKKVKLCTRKKFLALVTQIFSFQFLKSKRFEFFDFLVRTCSRLKSWSQSYFSFFNCLNMILKISTWPNWTATCK